MGLIEASRNVYNLPFNGKVDIRPAPFHYNRKIRMAKGAVDFALEIGVPIIAVRKGIVHSVVDKYGRGKFDKRFLDLCNYVIIEHENEEFSAYVHLKRGILVEEGDKVNARQLIGYSGLSGFTGYPHLHFEIMKVNPRTGDFVNIPARFKLKDEIKVLKSPKK
jgi:murein DD-endopeptidase MepM/ murein hydrolase activator NlpD